MNQKDKITARIMLVVGTLMIFWGCFKVWAEKTGHDYYFPGNIRYVFLIVSSLLVVAWGKSIIIYLMKR